MHKKLIKFARKLGVACAVALAVIPAAFAAEHSIVIPERVAERGLTFVMETVVRNVQTGERAVVSEQCVARAGAVATLECIQINSPDAAAGKPVVLRGLGSTI